MKAIIAAFAWFAGFIIVPVLCLITPKHERCWRWLDSIYGNKIDGIDGDSAYKAKVRVARRFRWSQLRNPINNLLRRFGPAGVVESVEISDTYQRKLIKATIGGRKYAFLQYRIAGDIHFWFGHVLLNDDRIDSKLEEGHHFENRMVLWPLKGRRV
jgi:hypothetical protein